MNASELDCQRRRLSPRRILKFVPAVIATCSLAARFSAEAAGQPAPTPAATAPASADEAAIHKSAADFVAAFKQHDARAIANMWTEKGEYVDLAGQVYQGRETIQKLYELFFAGHPGTELLLNVESIRFVGPRTAIEEGSAAARPQPAGGSASSRYVAVNVKQDDGKWLLASVRDLPASAAPAESLLPLLDMFVGDWTADNGGTEAELTGRWNENKTFVERRFTVTRNGQVVSSSLEIVGWDPKSQRITSSTFSSDGGRAQGTWTALEDGWVVQSEGTTADGATTASIDVWAPLQDRALGWRSTQRSVGGKPVADAGHIVLKKKPGTTTASK